MIVDASVVIPWLVGDDYPECERFRGLLTTETARFAPITVTELLSDRTAGPGLSELLAKVRRVELLDGYWDRAGATRRLLLRAGRRARTPDTLVVQVCIDAGLPLLTRDQDFCVFAELAGLQLA